MKAIILAAGYGGRMSPLTKTVHKTLLKVNGQHIMNRIIDSLVKNHILEIIIVTGYKHKDLVNHLKSNYSKVNFKFINNPRYRETNNIYSLSIAFQKTKFDKDILLIESDLIFSENVIEKAVKSKYKNLALVSPYKTGLDGTVVQIDDNKITNLFPPHLQGSNFNLFDKYKTLNIYKFSKEFCEKEFRNLLIYYAKSIDDNCYYELILGILIYMQREEIYCEIINNDDWTEVDDPNDLTVAEFAFNKNKRISILEDTFGGYWNFDIIDFCFIRNMYFPTKSMISEIKNNLPYLLQNYGSKQAILNKKLSYVLQYNEDRLIALNGAAQIYPILSDILKDSSALIPNPTFGEYLRVFNITDTYSDTGEFDYSLVESKFENISNIVIVNPNNPTGSIFITTWILEMINKYPNKFFIIDESFIEFSDQPSVIDSLEIEPKNNVIVIRSMSKTYGFPGVRLGFIYSCNQKLISKISSKIPIWNLNSVSEFFMEIILKNKLALEKSIIKTKLDREIFVNLLNELEIIEKVYKSDANFILFRVNKKLKQKKLSDFLIKKYSIYVKDVSDKFNSEYNNYFRVAVRDFKDNSKLINALKNI